MVDRTVDLWDLALPVGMRYTRKLPHVGSTPDQRVLLSRNLDARPQRTWEWQRDACTDMEGLRLRELVQATAGVAPVALWLPRRNALCWTQDMALGYANGSPRVGWALVTAGTGTCVADAVATPDTTGVAAELLSTGPGAPAELWQHVGRCPRREHQLTLSMYLQEHPSTPSDVRLELVDVDSGNGYGCTFAWSGGAAVAGTPDAGVTATSDGATPWSRVAITVDLALATDLRPSYTVAAMVQVDPTGTGGLGAYCWGAQLVLGDDALAYRAVGPRRMNPVAVRVRDAQWERQGAIAQRLSCTLVEQVR